MLVVASIAFIVGLLAHHLGLAEAIANVISKVLKCAKCLVFWTVQAAVYFYSYDPLYAVGVAMLCSYMSHWVGLILVWLNSIYNKIWQKVNK